MPCDAAVEQEPESVVVEVAEPVADAFDLFDEQVHGLRRPVRQAGVVVGEHLVVPGGDGLGEPGQFGDVGLGAPVVEGGDPAAGMRGIDGGVYRRFGNERGLNS